jgi:hypothetical protein
MKIKKRNPLVPAALLRPGAGLHQKTRKAQRKRDNDAVRQLPDALRGAAKDPAFLKARAGFQKGGADRLPA